MAFLFLLVVWMLPNVGTTALAAEDPMIVVSLGDSYSAGEGIEPFYGQQDSYGQPIDVSVKIYDHDWLAHRSKFSWPALLEVPGYAGTMKDYRQTSESTESCQWYFTAVSGAVSGDIHQTKQKKKAYKKVSRKEIYEHSADLPVQLDIFDKIDGTVDYVTISIGGNDVDFKKIVETTAKKSNWLGGALEEQLKALWDNIDHTMMCLENTYDAIEINAGPQAAIIVAGYPKLFDKDGALLISKGEAKLVNDKVTAFNDKISELVDACRNDGMNIHFVDVEAAFDADGGHSAYSDEPWINGIMKRQDEDINDKEVISSYSMHPNYDGALAYAACVNAKIAEIEANKKLGTLSGKVCTAADRTTPVQYTTINAFTDDDTYAYRASGDSDGNYSIKMEEGEYKVVINAVGYLPFTAYATVTEDENTYMETFLLVEGEEGETGVAQGMITNALTGWGIPEVNLEVREGWNNSTIGEVIATTKTNDSGNYSLTLPLGNYCLTASKDGYITGTVNIIVQRGTTRFQSGSITPVLSGDDYRVVLTWSANPRDLDSHMVGSLESGSSFHVYFGRKSQYDGSEEICNLDVDDTSGYGPETITLKANSDKPYYYYIYHFSGTGSVSSSEAVVKIYQGNDLVARLNVPTNQGTSRYWNVFAIVDGRLVIKNTITGSPDTNYANSTAETYNTVFAEEFLSEGSDKYGKSGKTVVTEETVMTEEVEEVTAKETIVTEEAAEESAEETIVTEDVAEEFGEETIAAEEVTEAAVEETEVLEMISEEAVAEESTSAEENLTEEAA